MRKLVPIIILLLLVSRVDARAQVVLHGIDKEEELLVTRLVLEFSDVPEFRVQTSGQRVDLFLSGATKATDLGDLPEEGKVIRVLLGRQKGGMMASFLLKTVPKSVKVLTGAGESQLILELAWDRAKGPARLAIASNIKGLPLLGSEGSTFRLAGRSEFSGRWLQVFSEYEAPLEVPVPLRYSLPRLPRLVYEPLAAGDVGERLKRGLMLGQKGDWPGAAQVLGEVDSASLQGVDKEACLLIYGEALTRTGKIASAHDVLSRFVDGHADSALYARGHILLCHLEAVTGDPYRAFFLLSQHAGTDARPNYYQRLGHLLHAEIDLVTGRAAKALKFLESKQELFTGALAPFHSLRLADALVLNGRSAEALPIYRRLDSTFTPWADRPYSMARMGEALFQQGRFGDSADRFKELSQSLGKDTNSLLLFAEVRSLLHQGARQEAMVLIEQLKAAYPASEGEARARMKTLDLEVVEHQGDVLPAVLLEYGQLSRSGGSRELREEAGFKMALLKVLQGPDLAGVQALDQFRSQYGGGKFARYAKALLGEVLPQVIQGLIGAEAYVEALVLVEKHRSLLVTGAVKSDFLVDLGDAFVRLGLLEKAARVYGYMLDAFEGKPAEASFYLPLVKVLDLQENHKRVVATADRYLSRFPQGEARSDMLFYKVRAHYARRELEAAAKILTDEAWPPYRKLDLLAGKVFWELEDFGRVETVLGRALKDAESREAFPESLAMYAESLFKQKEFRQALPQYRALASVDGLSDQARYRLAQILLVTGGRGEALKVLAELVEKGNDPGWKRVAEGLLLSETTAGR